VKNKIADLEIPEKGLKDFKIYIDTWKRLLNARMEENVLLKNTLSDILKYNYNQNSLEQIEEFQNKFISEDELIISLRKDVNDLDNLLSAKIFGDGKIEKSFNSKIENLQNDICKSANRFRILKSVFNDFQHKNIHPV
jgi:hypothetical protein